MALSESSSQKINFYVYTFFMLTLVNSIYSFSFQTVDSWRTIFYITVGMQLSGTICFILFGSAEPLNLDTAKSKEPVTELTNKIEEEVKL